MSTITGTITVDQTVINGTVSFGGGGGTVTTTKVVTTTETLAVSAMQVLGLVLIIPSATGVVSIGTTEGGGEIYSDTHTAGEPAFLNLNWYFNTSTTVYLTGAFTLKTKLESYA